MSQIKGCPTPEYDDPPCDFCGRDPSDCHCYDCPTCKGRGTVNPLTAPSGMLCISTTECPTCDGSGEMP